MDIYIDGTAIRNLFAKNLKRLRGILNMSQMDLSDITGLAHNFINDIENEKKFVSDDTIAKFSIALKVEPYKFFLPETKWNTQDEDILTDDFYDSIGMVVKEFCINYVKDNPVKEPDRNKPQQE